MCHKGQVGKYKILSSIYGIYATCIYDLLYLIINCIHGVWYGNLIVLNYLMESNQINWDWH
jgi:hypothetical protein